MAASESSARQVEKGEAMSSVKSTEKWRAVETALTQIERQFGKGSIMRLGDQPEQVLSVIPTGSLAVDAALGVGGIPRGRVVEVFGPEASGKTTLSLQIIAQAQKTGGLAAFIDAEHALDADYAHKLGVDTDNLLVSQPDNGEQALEIAEMLIRSGAIDVVVVDSVAALVPKAETEGEMGEAVVGSRTKVKVVKNKVASPFRQAEFDITYGEGISREGELIDMGIEAKILEKTGAWLSYGDLRIGQGRENAKQFLKENPQLAAEVETKLRKHLNLAAAPVSAAAEAASAKPGAPLPEQAKERSEEHTSELQSLAYL